MRSPRDDTKVPRVAGSALPLAASPHWQLNVQWQPRHTDMVWMATKSHFWFAIDNCDRLAELNAERTHLTNCCLVDLLTGISLGRLFR